MTEMTYERAEQLRKSKNFQDAVEGFSILWKEESTPMIGWRYAFCLRKLGLLEQAEKIAREAVEKFPQDQWSVNELIWVLYDKELKPARANNDLGRSLQYGKEILSVDPKGLALQRTSLLLMKVAKSRGNWEVVLEWADLLCDEQLSKEASKFGKKRVFSDCETWYVGRARALYELERYEEARDFAQQGLQEFPNEVFLLRIAALSLAELGQLEDAINEMRDLLLHPRADWYFKNDLAELEMRAGHVEEAYRLVCQSLIDSQQSEDKKLGAFQILTVLALEIKRFDVAAAHIELSKSIREQAGWKIKNEQITMEHKTRLGFEQLGEEWPVLPQKINELTKLCRKYWQEGVSSGKQRYQGTVKFYDPEKKYTFIARDDEGEDAFVLVKDLPDKCRKAGTRVDFVLQKSFDHKKNRESISAVYLRHLDL